MMAMICMLNLFDGLFRDRLVLLRRCCGRDPLPDERTAAEPIPGWKRDIFRLLGDG